jgi:hypothetical protein
MTQEQLEQENGNLLAQKVVSEAQMEVFLEHMTALEGENARYRKSVTGPFRVGRSGTTIYRGDELQPCAWVPNDPDLAARIVFGLNQTLAYECAIAESVTAEREACAKIAEEWMETTSKFGVSEIAHRIMARGARVVGTTYDGKPFTSPVIVSPPK